MDKTFYFMAGLPRSGSTLISSILNQNPRFYSGPSSPVVTTIVNLENHFQSDELFLNYPKWEEAKNFIASTLPQYYADREEEVIFDKNRSWTIRMEYISGYFNTVPKVICPVRDVKEILASFIAMHRRNPFEVNGRVNFIDEMLIKSNIPLTDDNRCEFLASPNGILGQSVEGLKKAVLEGYDHCLHFVEYKDLVTNPKQTIQKIYEFLDEEYYEHNFKEIKNVNVENDAMTYGFADMHDVRPKIKSSNIIPEDILSEQIIARCEGSEFWRSLNNEDVYDDLSIEDDELEEETNIIGG